MSHSDAFLDESVSLSSFSLNVFPKGMFRVETIVRIVFAAIWLAVTPSCFCVAH